MERPEERLSPPTRCRIGSPEKTISAELTQFLRHVGRTGSSVDERLLPRVYKELMSIAQRMVRGPASASSLVHDVYLKLFDRDELEVTDRHHFYALAARAMRQIIIDRARHARSEKHGGGRRPVTWDDATAGVLGADLNLIDLDSALGELTERNERQGRVVELRFFGGLEMKEVAEVLGVSTPTVERDWRCARAWLGQRLAGMSDK